MVYLDLQGHQSDHRRAEGQWGGEVRAQVEEGEPVGYTRWTDHTHDLAEPTTTLKKHAVTDDLHLTGRVYRPG